jgi:hypothetical protein
LTGIFLSVAEKSQQVKGATQKTGTVPPVMNKRNLRMEQNKSMKGALGAVLLFVCLTGILLTKYTFDGPGIGSTWPILLIGVGVVLAVTGYYEIALVITFGFALVLGGNLGLYSLRRAWPFAIAIIPAAVIIGYLRARAGKSPGPKTDN